MSDEKRNGERLGRRGRHQANERNLIGSSFYFASTFPVSPPPPPLAPSPPSFVLRSFHPPLNCNLVSRILGADGTAWLRPARRTRDSSSPSPIPRIHGANFCATRVTGYARSNFAFASRQSSWLSVISLEKKSLCTRSTFKLLSPKIPRFLPLLILLRFLPLFLPLSFSLSPPLFLSLSLRSGFTRVGPDAMSFFTFLFLCRMLHESNVQYDYAI